MTLEQAIEKAKRISRAISPYTAFVYEIDREDGRTYNATSDESYLDSDEFEAFNGETIAEYFEGEEC